MSGAARSQQHGYTLLETLVVAALASVGILSLNTFAERTHWLETEARASMALERALRLNLQSVGNTLRAASESTLEAFDGSDTSTRPEFERVVDGASGDRVLGGPALLEWRASAASVDGVSDPGDIYLVEGGTERVVARRVPADGFTVVRQGKALEIEISTYSEGTEANSSIEATGKFVVYVRN